MSQGVTEFIRRCQRIPPVMIDGALYTLAAMCIAANAFIGSDDAAKYMAPTLLFWIRGGLTTLTAGVVGLKMFRSTGYADHRAKVESETKT